MSVHNQGFNLYLYVVLFYPLPFSHPPETMKNRGFFKPLLHFDAMPIKLYNIKKKSYKYLFSFYNAVKIVRGQKYSVCPIAWPRH